MDKNTVKEMLENYKKMKEVQESSGDIVLAASMDFYNEWKDEAVTIPPGFVNWSLIIQKLLEEDKTVLGSEWEKLYVSPRLIEVLKGFAHLADYLVQYVNYIRKTTIDRNVNILTGLGYIEFTLDSNGKEKYFVTEKAKNDPGQVDVIEKTLKARESFANG